MAFVDTRGGANLNDVIKMEAIFVRQTGPSNFEHFFNFAIGPNANYYAETDTFRIETRHLDANNIKLTITRLPPKLRDVTNIIHIGD